MTHAEADRQTLMRDLTVPPRTVAVTGAGGSLGRALLCALHRQGDRLIALTSGTAPIDVRDDQGQPIPLRQVAWQCGREADLQPVLAEVDILVLNHGVNVHADRSLEAVQRSLEVNALSHWRLLELFATLSAGDADGSRAGAGRRELWVNTSEAEIQPAVSPLYEISKRLQGQLLSLRSLDLAGPQLRIRQIGRAHV